MEDMIKAQGRSLSAQALLHKGGAESDKIVTPSKILSDFVSLF
jgi:hypothetical protein